MADLNLTNFAGALKRRYPQRSVGVSVYKKNPGWAAVGKDETASGQHIQIGVESAPTTGVGATFATAQSNIGAQSIKQFLIQPKDYYSLFRVPIKTIRASRNDAGAIERAVDNSYKSALRALTNALGVQLYGDGSGSLSTISASTTLSSTTMLLGTNSDVSRFEAGMKIVFAASTTAALRSSTAITVSAVDRNIASPSLTLSATPASVSGSIAAGDVIFREGDYVSASDRLVLTGFGGWLPTTAPTSGDSFHSVDRSSDPVRLGGNRYDASGLPIDEALVNACAEIGANGGGIDTILMNPLRVRDLANVLDSKARYMEFKVGEVSFETLVLNTDNGKARILSDRSCPADKAYPLTLETWKLLSYGPCVGWLTDAFSGNYRLVEAADSIEGRLGGYPELSCEAPGYNGVITNLA